MHRNRLYQVSFAMLALVVGTSSLYALPASPLTATNNPLGAISLIYTLPTTGSPNSVTVALSTAAVATGPATSTYVTIDPTTVPYWLSVSLWSGSVTSPITAGSVAGTPISPVLEASQVAATMGAGVYTATVQADVIGYTPLNIPVTLVIKSAAATLTATGGTALASETWAIGGAQSPFTFSLSTSSVPISFTTTLSTLTSTGSTVASGISITPASGIVYTWGSTLSVVLSPLVYAKAVAGDVLTATVTINYEGTTMALPFQVTVTPPVALISSLFPAAVPVDTNAGDVVNFVINGTGFVPTGTNEVTAVFAAGNQLVTSAGVASVTVVNSTTIVVQITVGTTNDFAAAGTPLAIAVLNPNGNASPTVPTSPAGALANLNVVSVPIIYSVTSAATFIEPTVAVPTVFAPYDLITIFGNNLCPDCGVSSNPANLVGAPDGTYFRYPVFLTPDSDGHYLTVEFNKHSDHSLVAEGYLLFANNTQINVLVPSTLATVSAGALIGSGTVDIVVSYSVTAPPTAPLSTENSSPFTVGVVANDPGILTANSDGTGQGAILNSDYSLNSQTDAALHTTSFVQVYMTGLGAPTSTASNATTATALAYPTSCISALGATSPSVIIGYLTTMNTTTASPVYTAPGTPWTTVDGAVIQSAKIFVNGTEHYVPCISPVTASINSVAATVTYAGWVADSVAGLYQVNITVPAGAVPGSYPAGGGTPVSVPITVTVGGKTSQAGVTLWVK